MDQDKVSGSNKEVRGAVKAAIGQAIGDAKLQSDGEADKAGGKIEYYSSGLNAAVRDAEAMKSAGLLHQGAITEPAGGRGPAAGFQI